MKKFSIGLALITSGLAPHIAAAANCPLANGSVPAGPNVCMGSSSSTMTVQNCNGLTYVNSGTKCTCTGGYDIEGGTYSCLTFTTSSTSTSTGATQTKK
jgi:hypothetical protein